MQAVVRFGLMTSVAFAMASTARQPASAQAIPEASAAAPAATPQQENGVSNIVVTASRRAENLQKVPQAVSVVSAEALVQQNVVDVKALMRVAPSIKYQTGSLTVTQVLTLRGVGTLATNPNLQLSVGVAQDGITAARIAAATPDLVDIERIEVLKGPQGLLFGKNASAGLMNVITHKPVLGEAQAIGRAQIGGRGERQLSVIGNLPVGGTVALRVAAWHYAHDGLRAGLLWSPSPTIDVRLSGQWTRQDNDGAGLAIYKFQPGNFTAANRGALVQSNELAQGIVPGFRNQSSSNTVATFHKQDDSLYTGEVTLHLSGDSAITAMSSRSHTSLDDRYDPQAWNTTYGAIPVGGRQFRNLTRPQTIDYLTPFAQDHPPCPAAAARSSPTAHRSNRIA